MDYELFSQNVEEAIFLHYAKPHSCTLATHHENDYFPVVFRKERLLF